MLSYSARWKARNAKWERASAFGQARGSFKARLRRQDAHGAWQRDQPVDDARRTRVRRILKTVGHCSSDSVLNPKTDSAHSTIINS